MTDKEVLNIDSESATDCLPEIEASFGIKFGGDELAHIKTLGEFCDHVTNKIELAHADGCTTQQAFYKLRDAISTVLHIDNIHPDTPLSTIFPRQNRITKVKAIEQHLGFELSILSARIFISLSLMAIFVISFIAIFIHWPTGLCGIIAAILGFWLAVKTGKELDLQNVGQVAAQMQRENYLKSRRNPLTVNKKEIEKVLTDWFSNEFDLNRSQLTRDSKFV